ncbi:hypothetical protein BT69DRAFT_1225707, partial [Atractiella rhizophila]
LDTILGYNWLFNHNPSIDWRGGTIKLDRCPTSCGSVQTKLNSINAKEIRKELIPAELPPWLNNFISMVDINTPNHPSSLHFSATTSISQHLAQESIAKNPEQATEELPQWLQQFSDVFDEKEFDKLPERRK